MTVQPGNGAGPHAADRSARRSWLVATDADRERMMDMDRRLRPVRWQTFGVMALALVIAGWWVGWWTLVPLLGAAFLFRLAERRVDRVSNPEYWMLGSWAGAEAIIGVSLALMGEAAISMLALLAIPVVTLSARFSSRGVWLGVTIASALIVGVGLVADAAAVVDEPPLLIAPIAVAVASALLSTALMRSDVEHRDKAVLDSLTGLLNRNSLMMRVAELEQQSALTGNPVGVIATDLDGFKAINDRLGHPAGDSVLTEVGYLLRKALGRAFDCAYRVGGDEFLVLLPGADLQQTEAVAHRICSTISRAAVLFGAGIEVGISCGVSASESGEHFGFERVLRCADRALYEAKRSGEGVVARPSVTTSIYAGGIGG
jgi:diguanylate cyclase (GGDEF)-like protein